MILRRMGPFPAGVILHSYLGSAEMVPELAKLGAYFSFSGFLMSMQQNKAKKMLKMVIIKHSVYSFYLSFILFLPLNPTVFGRLETLAYC